MARLSVAIFAVLLATASAAISRIAVTECPHHPGQCQDPTTGEFHRAGTDWYHPGECRKHSCAFPDIIITGCPAVAEGPGCRVLPGDVARPFPDCCERVQCGGGH